MLLTFGTGRASWYWAGNLNGSIATMQRCHRELPMNHENECIETCSNQIWGKVKWKVTALYTRYSTRYRKTLYLSKEFTKVQFPTFLNSIHRSKSLISPVITPLIPVLANTDPVLANTDPVLTNTGPNTGHRNSPQCYVRQDFSKKHIPGLRNLIWWKAL